MISSTTSFYDLDKFDRWNPLAEWGKIGDGFTYVSYEALFSDVELENFIVAEEQLVSNKIRIKESSCNMKSDHQ
jgi:hypothetical protein